MGPGSLFFLPPLSAALARSIHWLEKITKVQKPTIYFRYVDDTLALFKQKSDVEDFLISLNRLHLALQFTFEREHETKLPFLDILAERTELSFETNVYRKFTILVNTYTGNFLSRDNEKQI